MDELFHNPNVLAGLSGLGAFTAVVLIWMALIESDPLPARLKSVADRRATLRAEEQRRRLSRRAGLNRLNVMKQIVQKLKLEQGRKLDHLRLRLARAGYRSRDTMFAFLFLKLALPAGAAGAAFFFLFVVQISRMPPIMAFIAVVFAGVIGFLLPDIFLKNLTQKRGDILRKAMPDALDLLVICAEAGLSLDASLERVSREIGPSCAELAEEIGLTAVELSFLPERPRALQILPTACRCRACSRLPTRSSRPRNTERPSRRPCACYPPRCARSA